MFGIVVIEQSWDRILSRTSILPKPQMISNQRFFHDTKSLCLHCVRLSFTETWVTLKV